MSTRYDQFCALARAAEILGERWTLLIVRELMLGPKRFTDLKGRLDGISASVLSERLGHMEQDGLIERGYLEPPAASNVFQLTATGHALEPAIFALIRWGGRFLMPARAGERREPDWTSLVFQAYARTARSPSKAFEVRIRENGSEAVFGITGGSRGTAVTSGKLEASVSFTADFQTILGLMSGRISPDEGLASGDIDAEGELEALSLFPQMFDRGGDTVPG